MAINPMLQKLGANNPVKQMLRMVQAAKDPYAYLNRLAQNNPQMRNAIEYVKKNGNDPKAAFYKMAQEKGVDPESILSQLR